VDEDQEDLEGLSRSVVQDFIDEHLVEIVESDAVVEHTRLVIHKRLAREWRDRASLWIDIINCVSEADKEHSRSVFRNWLVNELDRRDITADGDTGKHEDAEILGRMPSRVAREPEGDQPKEEELFEIASRVAAVLEKANSSYAELCTLDDDLSWVTKLVNATRSIRDIILALSEADGSPLDLFRAGLHSVVTTFNSFLTDGAPQELKVSISLLKLGTGKDQSTDVELSRRANANLTPLHSLICQSIVEYLVQHRPAMDLAVCTECSRIFERARRDNVFCSKTCQNRVAYKRKRLIDSGLLAQLPHDRLTVQTIGPGLWINHPRWGLGVVEAIRFTRKQLWYRGEDGRARSRPYKGLSIAELDEIPAAKIVMTAETEEHPVPASLVASVRYLSGIVRALSYSDLFGNELNKGRVSAFEVRDRETLMRLI